MGPGKYANAHHVYVLLQRGLGDLVRGHSHAHVDDLHAGVPHGSGNHLDTPVMPVQAQLGKEDLDVLAVGRCFGDQGRFPLPATGFMT